MATTECEVLGMCFYVKAVRRIGRRRRARELEIVVSDVTGARSQLSIGVRNDLLEMARMLVGCEEVGAVPVSGR